jgi:hypothetical protein
LDRLPTIGEHGHHYIKSNIFAVGSGISDRNIVYYSNSISASTANRSDTPVASATLTAY